MALSDCGVATDAREMELKKHGTAGFPLAAYHDDITTEPVPWHWHDELEIALVERGKCRFRTGAEDVVAGENEAVFFPPNVLHAGFSEVSASSKSGDNGKNPKQNPCFLHSLVFSPFLIGGAADSVFFEKYLNPLCRAAHPRMLYLTGKNAWERDVISHTNAAWEYAANEPDHFEIRIRNELSLAVAALAEHIPQADDLKKTDIRNEARMKEMLRFIHDNFADEIDAKQIAKSAHISESEALRCFKKMLGTTPVRYLLSYRLERAESLLLTTDLFIAEVGERCGFREMSYFAKAFHAKYGATPKAYRAKTMDASCAKK